VNVIAFFEYCPENFEKVTEKFKVAMADREKGSEKFPKIIFPTSALGGEFKGFSIYENPTEEQLNNIVIHYMPEVKFKFVQLTDAAKFIEQYFKAKK